MISLYTVYKASLHKHSFRYTRKKQALGTQGLVCLFVLSFMQNFIHRCYSNALGGTERAYSCIKVSFQYRFFTLCIVHLHMEKLTKTNTNRRITDETIHRRHSSCPMLNRKNGHLYRSCSQTVHHTKAYGFL